MEFKRRDILTSAALLMLAQRMGRAEIIEGRKPWAPRLAHPPSRAIASALQFFNRSEMETVEAIVDRVIPPDTQTLGGKDAGCAIFIDNQLAGPYGQAEGLYMQGPFAKGAASQGPQSPLKPQDLYRRGIFELERYCRDKYSKRFNQLTDALKDEVLTGLENGTAKLLNVDGAAFFKAIMANTKEGFFADPIYGGNRDMAGWKMIGFPGARYDYRDWVGRHNERYPHPPVSIIGRPEWTPS
jgi:gluconate 2-dehydrogenase gamma chain